MPTKTVLAFKFTQNFLKCSFHQRKTNNLDINVGENRGYFRHIEFAAKI